MSKKTSILIILVVILLIIGGLLYYYFSSNKQNIGQTSSSQTQSGLFGNTSGDKTSSTNTQTQTETPDNTNITKNTERLIQIYSKPTSGSIFITNTNNQSLLRFVDRAVGNVYEYLPETQTGEAQRVTNTTIPKIQEVIWSNSGSDLVLRYLEDDTDTIQSYSAKIKTNASSTDSSLSELTGQFLATNLKQLAINPKGDKIFALVDKSDKSGTYGFTTNLDNSSKKILLDSPISYWNISWPNDSVVTLTTKPNYKDNGILYFLNTKTYSTERILGNFPGMSTVTNKDLSLVAYSYSSNNGFILDVYDATNKISKGYKIYTLADKCVWGSSNNKILYCAIPKSITSDNYPDAWYQGTESFSDNIWKIDTETGKTEQLYAIGSNEKADIDAMDLHISPDDQYLSFSNKSDLSLWLLRIKE